jgi:hypothetical protein
MFKYVEHRWLTFPELTVPDYQDLLDTSFASAFTMADRAVKTIGQPGTPGTAAEWTFVDTEARDLAARIFGDGKTRGDRFDLTTRYTLVKSMLQCNLTSLLLLI